jgi:fucose permease
MRVSNSRAKFLLIGLAYLSFISLGLPDGLNGVAWPSIRAYFQLPLDALGQLLVMFTAGYLVSSFSSGRLLSLMSVGTLLALSCLATGVSLLGYAIAPAWWVMVALGLLAGLGAGAIDAGLNTFAATQFSARTINWLHASYGLGAAIGPLLMTSLLSAGQLWQRGYVIVGGWQLLLAACFAYTRSRWPRTEQPAADSTSKSIALTTSLKLPAVWLSILVFFVYCSIEATAGAWAYTLFTEARGAATTTAGMWVGIYWGALTVGRLLAGFVANLLPAQQLLRLTMIGIVIGAVGLWLNPIDTIKLPNLGGYLGLALMGLAEAAVFPTLIAATPARLGTEHTTNGVGFQIAAAVLGLSLGPTLAGELAHRYGLESIGPMLFVSALILLTLHEALLVISRQPNRP